MNKAGHMTRHCRECGQPFAAKRAHGHFCASACRSKYNNRRIQRGGEVYDLAMEWRFARNTATERKTYSMLCTLLGRFNDEDKERGRRSWSPSSRMMAINSRVGR